MPCHASELQVDAGGLHVYRQACPGTPRLRKCSQSTLGSEPGLLAVCILHYRKATARVGLELRALVPVPVLHPSLALAARTV